MKTKSIAKFHNEGLVFAINSKILHPLGMELGITQTVRKFSYYDTSKKLIETSLELKDIFKRFENIKKTLVKKPKFIQNKINKELDETIMNLTKIEPKVGLEIQTGKTRILITRENDGHYEDEGIVLSPYVKVKENETDEFKYEENAFEIYNKMLTKYMKTEGEKQLEIREKALGYMMQEDGEEE